MIDVIIPAYNAHKYLPRALFSICLQNIKDKVKVYVIDDCSSNGYDEIINDFKSELDIKLLRLNKNSGPGVAREFGLKNSNSQFIVFLDSDDMFASCYSLEFLLNVITGDNSDLCHGVIISEENGTIMRNAEHNGCLHGKMYRREFIKKNDIHFNDTRSSEDDGFNKLFLMGSPKVSYVDFDAYVYTDNKESITKSDPENFLFNSMKNYVYNVCWSVNEAKKRGFDPHIISFYLSSGFIYLYCIYMGFSEREDSYNILEWCHDLVALFDEFSQYISRVELGQIYNGFHYYTLPHISFDDFIELIRNYNK